MSELTEPQLRALKEIEAGRVRRRRYSGQYYSTLFPPEVRGDVIERLVRGRFAYVEASRHVTLTDRGREVLTSDA